MHPLIHYILFWIKSQNNLYVHSPFVFSFYNEVLKRRNSSAKIAKLIDYYIRNKEIVKKHDLGAGSAQKNELICDIFKHVSIPDKYGQVLSNIVEKYGSKNILELGTSLGMGTAYLSINENSRVISLDGNPHVLAVAKAQLQPLFPQIEFIQGDFLHTLPVALDLMGRVDLVYFDGNHRKQPTLDYFNICLPYSHEQSIFIFDDIYWSPEMTEAWEFIKTSSKITLTIDLYRMGIVFFDPAIREKQDFYLRF